MKTKPAARTVIIDDHNLTAIINVRNGEYYKIPGGGIEAGETVEQAALREALEEAGCHIEIVQEIGSQEFTIDDTIHQSTCFLAKRVGTTIDTRFDSWEQSNQMKVIWVTVDNAIRLFSEAKPTDEWGSKINRRDLDFVVEAQVRLNSLK